MRPTPPLHLALAAALTTGLAAACDPAGDDGFTRTVGVPAEDLPPAVRATLERVLPGGEVRKATKSTQGGRTLFEAEAVDGERVVDLDLKEDGTLLTLKTLAPAEDRFLTQSWDD